MDQNLKKICSFAYKTHWVLLVGVILPLLSFIPILGIILALIGAIIIFIGFIIVMVYLFRFSKYFKDKIIFWLPILALIVEIIGIIMINTMSIFSTNTNTQFEISMIPLPLAIITYVLWSIAYFKLGKYLKEMKVFWAYILYIIAIIISSSPLTNVGNNILTYLISFVTTLFTLLSQIIWIYTFRKLSKQ